MKQKSITGGFSSVPSANSSEWMNITSGIWIQYLACVRFFSPNTSRFPLGLTQPPTQWLPRAAGTVTKIMRKGYLYHKKCRPHALKTNFMILDMRACFTKVTEVESI